MHRYRLILLPAICSLAACGSIDGEFPSLAKRPYETNAAIIEPATTARGTAQQLPDSLRGRINSIETKFDAGRSKYQALLDATRATAARAAGSPVGSEAWVNAQLVVSRLDNARAEAVFAKAEIDAVLTNQLDAESQNQDALLSPLIIPIQLRIAAEVDAQNAELDQLARRIGL